MFILFIQVYDSCISSHVFSFMTDCITCIYISIYTRMEKSHWISFLIQTLHLGPLFLSYKLECLRTRPNTLMFSLFYRILLHSHSYFHFHSPLTFTYLSIHHSIQHQAQINNPKASYCTPQTLTTLSFIHPFIQLGLNVQHNNAPIHLHTCIASHTLYM